MSITIDFDNIIQIANDKTLSISSVKYGAVPSIRNVGTANDIKLEITIPPSDKDLDIEIGKVETGDTPSVKKRLDDGKLYLDFVLPIKGDQGAVGPQGDAATIRVGKVSIGNIAKVENVGTENNAILNFTLPYASGQGSYIPGDSSKGENSGGDKETAEELKNVTAGINRTAQATEELETTIANILAQVTAMVQQNNTIINRVVSQYEDVSKTLGDRIDANKLSIKAIQMSTIDKSMLDDTKDRISTCEKTVTTLRGELNQVFTNEVYRNDKQDILDRLDRIDNSIDAINKVLLKLESMEDSIDTISKESTECQASIELLQAKMSEVSATLAAKQDAGQLVTVNDLDAGLKNSIDAIDPIRVTANQNTTKIADLNNSLTNLAASITVANKTLEDIQKGYAEGDKTNKDLIDALSDKVDTQAATVNKTIEDIQKEQDSVNGKYAPINSVYTKKEVDDAIADFMKNTGGTVSGDLQVKGNVTADIFKGRFVGNADTATTAENATYDSEGNNISTTYVTKTDFNNLSGTITQTEAKASQAVSQLDGFKDKIADNANEIAKLKATDGTFAGQIDTLSKEKASISDLSALRTAVNTDRQDNADKQKALEDKFDNYMLKDTVIAESQLDESVAAKLSGIAANANAIAEIKTSQADANVKIDKNVDDISKIKADFSSLKNTVSQSEQSAPVFKTVTFDDIHAMFDEYMPKPATPEEPPQETKQEGGSN